MSDKIVTKYRKTGWCNNPSSDNPELSHRKCDGVFNEHPGVSITLCDCECHGKKEVEVEAPKKKTRTSKKKAAKKTKTKPIVTQCESHPRYKGIRTPRTTCETCMQLYEQNKEKRES
jgi:hypothetical protein